MHRTARKPNRGPKAYWTEDSAVLLAKSMALQAANTTVTVRESTFPPINARQSKIATREECLARLNEPTYWRPLRLAPQPCCADVPMISILTQNWSRPNSRISVRLNFLRERRTASFHNPYDGRLSPAIFWFIEQFLTPFNLIPALAAFPHSATPQCDGNGTESPPTTPLGRRIKLRVV